MSKLQDVLSDLKCASWALPQLWLAYRTKNQGERERKINWVAARLRARGRLRQIKRPGDGAVDGAEGLIPYIDRYFIIRSRLFGSFLHRFWASDAPFFHCHPWNNASFILNGAYTEHFIGAPEETMLRSKGDFRWRQAEVMHWLELPSFDGKIPSQGPVWTLFFRGRRRRKWGFYEKVGPFIQAKIQGSKREY